MTYRDPLSRAWYFATSAVKDPSKTFKDTYEGAGVLLSQPGMDRAINSAWGTLGVVTFGLGVVTRNPAMLALGAFDLAVAGGGFLDAGKDGKTSTPVEDVKLLPPPKDDASVDDDDDIDHPKFTPPPSPGGRPPGIHL